MYIVKAPKPFLFGYNVVWQVLLWETDLCNCLWLKVFIVHICVPYSPVDVISAGLFLIIFYSMARFENEG